VIKFVGQLKRKEERLIITLIDELVDFNRDFYITQNNLRLFIKENKDLFIKCLKKGDKMVYSEEDGIIFITGFSDRASRKYIKPLVKDVESADRLLKVLFWNINCDIWAKIKKTNPIKKVLLKNNFKFAGDRGKEILLLRKYIPQKPVKIDNKGAEDASGN